MRLLEHGREHQGDLALTLRTRFECVRDAHLTADRLVLHVNTVGYRLRRSTQGIRARPRGSRRTTSRRPQVRLLHRRLQQPTRTRGRSAHISERPPRQLSAFRLTEQSRSSGRDGGPERRVKSPVNAVDEAGLGVRPVGSHPGPVWGAPPSDGRQVSIRRRARRRAGRQQDTRVRTAVLGRLGAGCPPPRRAEPSGCHLPLGRTTVEHGPLVHRAQATAAGSPVHQGPAGGPARGRGLLAAQGGTAAGRRHGRARAPSAGGEGARRAAEAETRPRAGRTLRTSSI